MFAFLSPFNRIALTLHCMKIIKRFLSKILTVSAYLKVMHRGFYLLYRLNILAFDSKFKFHYAVKKWISPTDYVVDIGANLGYFSKTFSRLAHNGKVICIEPIPEFYETLKYFLGKKQHVEIHNIALGNETCEVFMAMPETDGFIRTGLPHIIDEKEISNNTKTKKVRVVKAHDFLSALPKISYIKCDIEGYEGIVFQELKNVLQKFRPYVQLEIAPENRDLLLILFEELNYLQFGIANFRLIEEKGEQLEEGDFLFIPKEKKEEFISRNNV